MLRLRVPRMLNAKRSSFGTWTTTWSLHGWHAKAPNSCSLPLPPSTPPLQPLQPHSRLSVCYSSHATNLALETSAKFQITVGQTHKHTHNHLKRHMFALCGNNTLHCAKNECIIAYLIRNSFGLSATCNTLISYIDYIPFSRIFPVC